MSERETALVETETRDSWTWFGGHGAGFGRNERREREGVVVQGVAGSGWTARIGPERGRVGALRSK